MRKREFSDKALYKMFTEIIIYTNLLLIYWELWLSFDVTGKVTDLKYLF